MVKRVFSFFNSQIRGLHEAAYLLAGFALLSQLLALVRDRLLAHTFGAGSALDIYYAAFRIPDFIFVFLGSTVSLFVLIPLLLERLSRNEDARPFINTVFTSFFGLIVAASIAAFIATPLLVRVLFPGFGTEDMTLLTTMTRIMLFSPILLGISNILTGITQAFRRFIVFGLSPIFYNLGIILGVLFFVPRLGVVGLAWGVVLAALLHMVVQLPAVTQAGLLPRLTTALSWKALARVVATSLPRTVTLSLNQLVLLALVATASLLAEGSIAIFNFGFNIQGVPLTLIGVSYSVAAFPTLARLFSEGERSEFLSQMARAVRHILFWALPATVFFIVLRAQIVRVALGSGQFDWADTRLTAAVLALFVVSLVAQALEMLFIRGYYAAGETWRPFAIKVTAALSVVLAVPAGLLLFARVHGFADGIEKLLRIDGLVGTSIVMLAGAYAFGTILSATLFWVVFQRDFGGHLPSALEKGIWQSALASLALGAASYSTLSLLAPVFDLNTFLGIFLQGFIAGLVGLVAGVLILFFLGNREIREVWAVLHHRFWRSRPIVPEADDIGGA